MFSGQLRVSSYKFVGVGEASSKKEAQTEAAWNFADYLVKEKELQASELPAKSVRANFRRLVVATVLILWHQRRFRHSLTRSLCISRIGKYIPPLLHLTPLYIPPFPLFVSPTPRRYILSSRATLRVSE